VAAGLLTQGALRFMLIALRPRVRPGAGRAALHAEAAAVQSSRPPQGEALPCSGGRGPAAWAKPAGGVPARAAGSTTLARITRGGRHIQHLPHCTQHLVVPDGTDSGDVRFFEAGGAVAKAAVGGQGAHGNGRPGGQLGGDQPAQRSDAAARIGAGLLDLQRSKRWPARRLRSAPAASGPAGVPTAWNWPPDAPPLRHSCAKCLSIASSACCCGSTSAGQRSRSASPCDAHAQPSYGREFLPPPGFASMLCTVSCLARIAADRRRQRTSPPLLGERGCLSSNVAAG